MPYERQRKVIIILSIIITIIILGLAKLSILSAETSKKGNDLKGGEPTATTVMRWMISPPEVIRAECEEILTPKGTNRCKPFLFLDEGSLQDLINSYPACLEEPPYSLNLEPVPEILLSRPLVIYGQTNEPLKIRGLKLKAGSAFPQGEAAIKLAGGGVSLEGITLQGFDRAVELKDTSKHMIALGKINGHSINSEDILVCN